MAKIATNFMSKSKNFISKRQGIIKFELVGRDFPSNFLASRRRAQKNHQKVLILRGGQYRIFCLRNQQVG